MLGVPTVICSGVVPVIISHLFGANPAKHKFFPQCDLATTKLRRRIKWIEQMISDNSNIDINSFVCVVLS